MARRGVFLPPHADAAAALMRDGRGRNNGTDQEGSLNFWLSEWLQSQMARWLPQP